MIAPTNLTPPKNWQDFETLCLKLWGEIWNIPHEIEFNSDNSQGQQGVDIYGAVNGAQYFGIQCKNKKLNLIDGIRNRITVKDIQAEIDKAKLFKPPLAKLIIATSLQKDQKIEEYVRIMNVENLQAGLFSIQICFWDYLERKIPEFQKVYDWYLKNENFHRVREIGVLFSDRSRVLVYKPKFLKTIERYTTEQEPKSGEASSNTSDLSFLLKDELMDAQINKILEFQLQQNQAISQMFPKINWEQTVWFKLFIKNIGQAVIEDYKIELDFEGEFEEVGAEYSNPILNPNFTTNVRGYSNSKRSLWIKPSNNILVQNDSFSSGSIYLQPLVGQSAEVKLYWKLLSRDFEDSGSLEIQIRPLFHKEYITHYNVSGDEEKTIESVSLIKRKGTRQVLTGGINFSDKESDFKFE